MKYTQLRNSSKLIMTLLVRNEEDIVRYNIDFHLSRGVDFIIATDNGSTDGTVAVLKEYEQKGLLHLLIEPVQNHDQATWNNRMARIAKKEYGADIIFHCDADEFWYPRSGNLKDEILQRTEDILIVELQNVLLTDRGGEESFPRDTRYAVVDPMDALDYQEETKHRNLFHFKYPPKVMFKTREKIFHVGQGNHFVMNKDDTTKEGLSSDVVVYHYPVRSKTGFYKKVIRSGSAYESTNMHKKLEGFHVRRWYAAYKEDRLDEEYQKLLLHQENIAGFVKAGFIEKMDFAENILGKEKEWSKWITYYRPFEYENIFNDLHFPWAGHKYFAYDLVRNIKPAVIVDLKTDGGTSFLSFCQAVKDGRYDAHLYSIDAGCGHDSTPANRSILQQNIQTAIERCYPTLKLELIPTVAEKAASSFEDCSIDLLNADGFFTFDEIKRCIDGWLPKMKPDGIILIHDIFTKNNDSQGYRYWEDIKKECLTVEFHHSFGLGILCLSPKIYQDFKRRERDWQMEYTSHTFDKQCKAMQAPLEHFRKSLLADLEHKMFERDQALALVDQIKASRSWRLTAPIRFINHALHYKIYSVKSRFKKEA